MHGTAAVLALAAATVWPRPGEAALLVPLAGKDFPRVIGWATSEGAALLELDSVQGRVIARLPDYRSPFGALREGIFPIATRARNCQSRRTPT
jgi:hypothetical protein